MSKFRRIFSTQMQGPDAGRWVTLDDPLSLPSTGGKFVGYASGKIALVNGANTGDKIAGFLHANVIDILSYAAGAELFLCHDLQAKFSIKLSADVPLRVGQAYNLKIVAGEQVLDVSAPGTHVIVDDPDSPGHHFGATGTPDSRFVLVKLNPAALA